ncbi:MAG: esterase YqiA [SAR86 cluster bacterium]|uniref:Esterase YqiA n=1 Tax=SAR86 cluster bacterium TaxID=2030880 RepID=A0A2A5AZ10_9GAMM|nr:MAG: esterase YqiA [SAR86 cluster bacterium]
MSVQPFVIYLHGFLSSPQSKKAQQTLKYCSKTGLQDRIAVPSLGNGPLDTIKELRALIDAHQQDQIVLIGSSLGGYYATYLSQEYGFPAVLINPAVRPYELWESHLGEHRNYYSGEIHVVTKQHIEELQELNVIQLKNPSNFMVLVQTGDETLDYRQAVEKFSSSHCVIRENGSHSYDNFYKELPDIFDFLLSRIA